MKFWRGRKKKVNTNNSRINFIIAIIFLLGGSILYRLYYLQIKEYDFYVARADGQHQVSAILSPQRGRIFAQENPRGGNSELYPLATNKKFASVYAVPRDIKYPEKTAAILYDFFKKEGIEKEVEKILEEMDEEKIEKNLKILRNVSGQEREIGREEAILALAADEEYQEFRKIKMESETDLRKDEEIDKYLQKLTKKNDPYEPIEQKVPEKILKKLYAALASDENMEIEVEDLEIKEGTVFIIGSDGEGEKLKTEGIDFIMKSRRFYPEGNISSHLLGFVGYVGDGERGRYGLEGFFEEELYGEPGSIKTGRGASGDLIIINDREYRRARDGSDLILTINRTIQYTACQKLNETAKRHGADGGSIVILEPKSGGILAMCSWPDYDPNYYQEEANMEVFNNPAIFYQYEPGSIFKTITMAAALDSGVVSPSTTYNDEGSVMVEGWPKPIKNSDYESRGGHGLVDMTTVLSQSLNTGAIFMMEKITPNIFTQYVKDFGFGEKTGIELETEGQGNINNLTAGKIKPIHAATASFGQGITTTPLQMAAAYGAIANGGILMKPYLVKEIVRADGSKTETQPRAIRRVISERAAVLISGMLVNVIDGGHAKRAGVNGYYVAGKTGTAQVAETDKRGYGERTIHTFVGFAPVEEPRFVMLVKLDDPKSVDFSASSAAPLFGELAEFILNYLEVPKDR